MRRASPRSAFTVQNRSSLSSSSSLRDGSTDDGTNAGIINNVALRFSEVGVVIPSPSSASDSITSQLESTKNEMGPTAMVLGSSVFSLNLLPLFHQKKTQYQKGSTSVQTTSTGSSSWSNAFLYQCINHPQVKLDMMKRLLLTEYCFKSVGEKYLVQDANQCNNDYDKGKKNVERFTSVNKLMFEHDLGLIVRRRQKKGHNCTQHDSSTMHSTFLLIPQSRTFGMMISLNDSMMTKLVSGKAAKNVSVSSLPSYSRNATSFGTRMTPKSIALNANSVVTPGTTTQQATSSSSSSLVVRKNNIDINRNQASKLDREDLLQVKKRVTFSKTADIALRPPCNKPHGPEVLEDSNKVRKRNDQTDGGKVTEQGRTLNATCPSTETSTLIRQASALSKNKRLASSEDRINQEKTSESPTAQSNIGSEQRSLQERYKDFVHNGETAFPQLVAAIYQSTFEGGDKIISPRGIRPYIFTMPQIHKVYTAKALPNLLDCKKFENDESLLTSTDNDSLIRCLSIQAILRLYIESFLLCKSDTAILQKWAYLIQTSGSKKSKKKKLKLLSSNELFRAEIRKQVLCILEKISFLLPPTVTYASFMKTHLLPFKEETQIAKGVISDIFDHFELDIDTMNGKGSEDHSISRSSTMMDRTVSATGTADGAASTPNGNPSSKNRNLTRALGKMKTEKESKQDMSERAEGATSTPQNKTKASMESNSFLKGVEAKVSSKNPFLSKGGGKSSFQFGHFTSKMTNMDHLFRLTKHPKTETTRKRKDESTSKPMYKAVVEEKGRTHQKIPLDGDRGSMTPCKKQKLDPMHISETPLRPALSFVGETPQRGMHGTPPCLSTALNHTPRDQMLSPMISFAFSQDTPFKAPPAAASSLVADAALAASRTGL